MNRPFNLDRITVDDIMGNLQTLLDGYEQRAKDFGPDGPDDHTNGIIYGLAEAMSLIRSLMLLRLVRDKDTRHMGDLYSKLDDLIIELRKTDGTIVPAVITDRGMNFETGVIDITVQDRTETIL